MRNDAITRNSKNRIRRALTLVRFQLEFGIDQSVGVQRDACHNVLSPYKSSSVIVQTRNPVTRFVLKLCLRVSYADCQSLERSLDCGDILATGVPFLVIIIVSPCSAAAIT